MAKSISFIVPAYCTDKNLLDRCLKSIVAIDTDWELEVIVVDDGTPDCSIKDTVNEINDNRITYHYQENAGLGQARNTGVSKATKEYIQFIDSDDYLFPNVFARCLCIIDKYNPDVLSFGFKNVFQPNIEQVKTPYNDDITHITNGIDYMLGNSFIGAACNMIIKRQILFELPFTAGILHEDEEFKPRLFLRTKKLIVTGLKPYAYYHHSNSIMGNIEPKKLERRFNDMLYVIDSLRNISSQLSGKAEKALNKRIEQLYEVMLFNAIRLSPDKPFFKYWFNRLKEHGIYPFPKRDYNFNYKLFRFATNKDWKIRLIYMLLNRR